MMSKAHPVSPLLEQRRFQALLIQGGEASASLLRVGSERGLQVYQHAYRSRLLAALRDNYPVLLQAMGDDSFDALGHAYLDAHPSTEPSIRWFGHRLAEFMAGVFAEQLGHPAFVDVARMDWALRGAFDAADDPALTAQALQGLAAEAWAGLRLQPRAATRLLPLDWAVEPAWAALARHQAAVDAAIGSGEDLPGEPELPEPEVLAHQLLIWRPALETRWRSLDEAEATLVAALFGGASIAELGVLAAGLHGEAQAPAVLSQTLQRWLAEGWLRAPV